MQAALGVRAVAWHRWEREAAWLAWRTHPRTCRRLCYASACLLELEGCLFVATNPDHADNIGNGRMMPGTGCLVAAVETATRRRAFNVGKGGDWLLPFLCSQLALQPATAMMVGDRLDTDIALGKQGGLRTCLPLTGVTQPADLAAAPPAARPDFVVRCLAVLAGLDPAGP